MEGVCNSAVILFGREFRNYDRSNRKRQAIKIALIPKLNRKETENNRVAWPNPLKEKHEDAKRSAIIAVKNKGPPRGKTNRDAIIPWSRTILQPGDIVKIKIRNKNKLYPRNLWGSEAEVCDAERVKLKEFKDYTWKLVRQS